MIKEKVTDATTISGEVTYVERAGNSPRYYFDGGATHGLWIYIEGKKYYIVDTHDIESGDKLEIVYLPRSHIVLEYRKVVTRENE